MTTRDRTVVVVGLVAIGLILVAGKGLPRAIDWHRATVDEVGLRIRAVGGLQERLARASTLSDSLAWLEGAVSALQDRMLRGATIDEAQLDLIRRLTAASTDSTLSLDSLRIEAAATADTAAVGPTTSPPIREVVALASATSDLEGIATFIGRIEGDPALWIERFSIRSMPADASGPEIVAAELYVGGWRLVVR